MLESAIIFWKNYIGNCFTNLLFSYIIFIGFAGPCTSGHYCPEGSSIPIGCARGSYSDQSGQSVCHECPAAYYCPQNCTSFENNKCPAGELQSSFKCANVTRPCTQCQLCMGGQGQWCSSDSLSTKISTVWRTDGPTKRLSVTKRNLYSFSLWYVVRWRTWWRRSIRTNLSFRPMCSL